MQAGTGNIGRCSLCKNRRSSLVHINTNVQPKASWQLSADRKASRIAKSTKRLCPFGCISSHFTVKKYGLTQSCSPSEPVWWSVCGRPSSYDTNWTVSAVFRGKLSLFQMTAVRSHSFWPCYCCICFPVAQQSLCADNGTAVIRLDRIPPARLLTQHLPGWRDTQLTQPVCKPLLAAAPVRMLLHNWPLGAGISG